MGICTTRHILLTTCTLQLLTTIERQFFDFLGFMWAPILVNFFEIIFVIFGLFGAFQYRCKYVASYCLWDVISFGWNVLVICFYLDVGTLDKNSDLLNLGTGSVSWWESNGYKCKPYYSPNITGEDIYRPVRPEIVTGCLLEYTVVEIIHAGIQLILALTGLIGGLCLSRIIKKARSKGKSTVSRKATPKNTLYSIEFSRTDDGRQNDSDTLESETNVPLSHLQAVKPMTPRRVKRRSVMTRGHPGHGHHGSTTRRSTRASQRRIAQNPVTQLIEQQQQQQQHHHHHHHQQQHSAAGHISSWQRNGHTNPTYQQSSIQSLNEQADFDIYNNRPPSARSSYSNFHGMRHIAGQNYGGTTGHATPQAPLKRDRDPDRQRHRQSLRSMAFLNSGPPAYTLQGNHPLDSETTI